MSNTTLRGKVVCITGASSGIGAACAHRFAEAGAHLILCARRQQRLEELAHTLQHRYDIKVKILVLDIRDKDKIKTSLGSLSPEWQSIDILINNAGLARGMDKIQQGNPTDWDEVIDTNIKGLLYVTHAILPTMINRNIGHIVNVGSIAGHLVYPQGNVYCATKFAVRALSDSMRIDLLGTPIRVTLISPGMVETEFSNVRFRGDNARAKAVYANIHALTAEDIADAIVYATTTPAHVNISEITLTPTAQVNTCLVQREK